MNRLTILAAVSVVAMALGGCGDNADPVAVAPVADPLANVPASAQVDGAGLVAYLEVLAVNTVDDRDAVNVDAVVLTQSDYSEPLALK